MGPDVIIFRKHIGTHHYLSVIIFFIDWYLYPLAPPPILVCGLFSVLSRLPSLRG